MIGVLAARGMNDALDMLVLDDGRVDDRYLCPVGITGGLLLWACRAPVCSTTAEMVVAIDDGQMISLIDPASLKVVFGPFIEDQVLLPIGRFLRSHRDALKAFWAGRIGEMELDERIAAQVE